MSETTSEDYLGPWQENTPVDILHEIFDWLIYFAPSEPRSRNAFPTWLRPIHLCKSWRVAAMSYSLLWRYLPLENYTMTKTALRLSLPRTVIIDLRPDLLDSVDDCDEEATEEFVARAFHPAAVKLAFRCSRAESLSMPFYSGYLRSIPDIYAQHFKFPKMLLDLELWAWCIRPEESFCFLSKYMFDPGTVKRLRSLRLVANAEPVEIHKSLLNSLNSLTFLELRHNQPVWTSLSELFKTLRRMPKLEALVLGCSTLPHRGTLDPGSVRNSDHVDLPHLRRLSLAGNDVSICRVLEHVVLPICQYLSFNIDDITEIEVLEDAQLDLDDFETDPQWENWDVGIKPICSATVESVGARQENDNPIRQLALISDNEVSAPSWVSDPLQLCVMLSSFPLLHRINLAFLPGGDSWVDSLWQDIPFPDPLVFLHLTHLNLEGPAEFVLKLSNMIEAPNLAYKALCLSLPPHAEDRPNDLDASWPLTSFEVDIRHLISVSANAGASSSYTELYVVPGFLEQYPRIVATKPVHLEGGMPDMSLPYIIDLTILRYSALEEDEAQDDPEYLGMVCVALARALQVIPLSAVASVHLAYPMASDQDVLRDALRLPVQTARRLALRYISECALPTLTAIRSYPLEHLEELSLIDLEDEDIEEKLVSLSKALPLDRVNGPLTVHIERCTFGERMKRALYDNAAIDVRWDRSDEALMLAGWRVTERPWVAPFDRRTRFWRDEDVWVP